MQYNIYFEVAAAIFIVILYIYTKLQYTRTDVNLAFQSLLLVILMADVLDVSSAITISYGTQIPVWINVAVNSLYFFADALLGYYFLRYCSLYVHGKVLKTGVMRFNRISIWVYFCLLVVNVFTNWVFGFTNEGIYYHGPIYLVVYLIVIYYVILSALVLRQSSNEFAEWQKVSFAIYMCLEVAGPLLQMMVFPDILLSVFSSSLCAVIMLFSMETPDYQKLSQAMEELERANNSATNAQAVAEAADRAKSVFVASISHEIRTPLNAIMGLNEMILQETNNPKVRDYAQGACGAGQNLLSILNDVLDFSKIESGKLELTPREYDPMIVIKSLYEAMFRPMQIRGLQLKLDVRHSLPGVLYGDENKVRQVLTNYLSNAMKYTEQGSVTIICDYKKNSDDEIELYLAVKDTGKGIREQDRAIVFDAYTRMEEHEKSQIEGTGLGLSIVKSVVGMMDGECGVDSIYGKGSLFYAIVPQKVRAWTPSNVVIMPKAFGGETPEKINLEQGFEGIDAPILLVDDVSMNHTVFTGLLRNSGVKVVSCFSGRDALERCEREHFSLIFMDYVMPEMNGHECLLKLREMSKNKNLHTPVVMITADTMMHTAEELRTMGFVAQIAKPFRKEELVACIRKNAR